MFSGLIEFHRGKVNPCPAEPRYALPLHTVQIQISWLLKNGSTLFVIKYVNLYQKTGSSNLIG